MDRAENRTFDELQIGDTASIARTLSNQDIELFAVMSGDVNPAHVDPEFAKSDMFHKVVAHGMWGGALPCPFSSKKLRSSAHRAEGAAATIVQLPVE